MKASVLAAVWNAALGARKRTPGVVHSLFLKGHVCDVWQASLTSRWLSFLRVTRNDPSFAELIWDSRNHGHWSRSSGLSLIFFFVKFINSLTSYATELDRWFGPRRVRT